MANDERDDCKQDNFKAANCKPDSYKPDSCKLANDELANCELANDETSNDAKLYPSKRIVSLTPTASELICIFGGLERIVGRDDHSTFPAGLVDKPALGSSIKRTIEARRVLDLDPDVVIVSRHFSPEVYREIESAGVAMFSVGTGCELKDLMNNIKIIEKITGSEKRAKDLSSFLKRYEDLIRERIGGLDPNGLPGVYHECAFARYKTTASCTSADSCISFAAGRNIACNVPSGKSVVNGEWVAKNNPDIIITQISSLSPEAGDLLKEKRDEMMSRPELGKTGAVRNGQVYVSHLSIRRGPRLITYLLYLAKWLHPDLFRDINPAEVHRELLREFYGIDAIGTVVYP